MSEIGPVTKAAAILMAIGPDGAAKILRMLPSDIVDRVASEMMRGPSIDASAIAAVAAEAIGEVDRASGIIPGGEEYAYNLIASIYGSQTARDMIERIHRTRQPLPFSFLKRLEPAQVKELIENEQPQTIALVLAYLDPKVAAKVLTELPAEKKIEVATRIATTEPTTAESLAAAERGLQRRVETLATAGARPVGGVKPIASVLNQVDRSSEREIIEGLAARDQGIADAVRRLMFTFDDLVLIDDRGMQRVITEIGSDMEKLAIALKGASEPVRKRFFDNMSSRTAGDLTETLQSMPQTRRKNVDEAQQEIVEIIRRLEEAEEIIINRGGEANEVI